MGEIYRARVAAVTDGDTVRLHLARTLPIVDGWEAELRSTGARGRPVRLVTLDTPERGEPGFYAARDDLLLWCAAREGRLEVELYTSAGWDRVLGDLYVAGNRGETASQALLLAGWNPYLATS